MTNFFEEIANEEASLKEASNKNSGEQSRDFFAEIAAEESSGNASTEVESDDKYSLKKGDFIPGLKKGIEGSIASGYGMAGLVGASLEKEKDTPYLKTLAGMHPVVSAYNSLRDIVSGDDNTSVFDKVIQNLPTSKGMKLASTAINRVGDLIGADVQGAAKEIQKVGFEGHQKHSAEAAKYQTVSIKDILEADGLSNKVGTAIDWAQGGLGQLLPTIVETAATTAIGYLGGAAPGAISSALGGRTLLKKAILKAVDEQVLAQVEKGLIKKGAEQVARKEIQKMVTDKMVSESRNQAMKIGGKIGMAAGSLPLEAGGNYGDLLAEKGIKAPETALFFGALATSLEFAGGNSKLVDKFIDAVGSGSGKFIKQTAKELLSNIPEEALQESSQEVLSILNTVSNTDEKLLTAENLERVIEAGALGALGGGAGAVGGSVLNALGSQKNLNKADKDNIDKTKVIDKIYANITSHGPEHVLATVNKITEDIAKANDVLRSPEELKKQAAELNISVEDLTTGLREQILNSIELKKRLVKEVPSKIDGKTLKEESRLAEEKPVAEAPKEYWQVWEDEINQQREGAKLREEDNKKYLETQQKIQNDPDYQRRKAIQEQWNAAEKTNTEKEQETANIEATLKNLQKTKGLTDEEIARERASFYEAIWGTESPTQEFSKSAARSSEVFTEQSEDEYKAIEKAIVQKHIENIMQEPNQAKRELAYNYLFGRPGVKDAQKSAGVFLDQGEEALDAREKDIYQNRIEGITQADRIAKEAELTEVFNHPRAKDSMDSFDLFNRSDLLTRDGKPYQRRSYLEGYINDMPDASNWDIVDVPGGFVGIRKILKSDTPLTNRPSPFKSEPQVAVETQLEKEDINLEPSDAQKEAGNYKKASIELDGFKIKIENPNGSTRSGKDADGNEWSSQMNGHYGYFERSEGKDGDQVDVFIKPDTTTSPQIFVVDQINPKTGKFDEHKVIMGATSEEDARNLYLSNYEKGWQGLGSITEMNQDEFKSWLGDKKRTKKPLASKNESDLKFGFFDKFTKGSKQVPVKAPVKQQADIAVNTELSDMMRSVLRTRAKLSVNESFGIEVFSDLPDTHERADEMKRVKLLGNKLGTRVFFFNAPNWDVGGMTLPNMENHPKINTTDMVFINVNSENPYLQIFGHEFIHSLKVMDVHAYDSLLRSFNTKIVGTRLNKYLEKINARRPAAMQISVNDALKSEEFIADFVGESLMDQRFLADLRLVDKNLAEQISVIIDKILERIQTVIRAITSEDFGEGKKGEDNFRAFQKDVANTLKGVSDSVFNKEYGQQRNKYGEFRLQADETSPELQTIDQGQIPGQGLKQEDIQKMYPGQDVFFGEDNTVSLRFKNGQGITFQTMQDAGKGFIEFAIQTGQMSENGKILGVTVGNNILLDKDFADKKTGWHENLHALENIGMVTTDDISAINKEFNKLRESKKLGFELSKHTDPMQRMKENRANTFAQIMVNREQYRNTPLGALIQKVKDFLDQVYVMGKRFITSNQGFQTPGSLAREVESGKFYERTIDDTTIQDDVDVDPYTVENFPNLTTQDKTSIMTQAFRNWFGRSKMRDKNGQPMIFYHYSPENITEFKHMPGANTGMPAGGLGHFFLGRKDPTFHYGEYEIAGYLRMEKPYKMTRDEFDSFTTVNEALARKEELENLGYDGIVVDRTRVNGFYVGNADPFFVIFDSPNVKSIYNEGTWNPEENNINLQVTEPISDQIISDEQYTNVYKQKANLLEKIQQSVRMKMSEVKLMADKSLTPISTRLRKIDSGIANDMRMLDFRTAMKINTALKEAYPIMKTKMSSEDKVTWDWARKNADSGKINQLVTKYGFEEHYNNLRTVLDQIRQDAIDVGYDVGYIDDYWPRIIKDQEGFLQATQGISREPKFTKALKEKADKLGITVTELRSLFPDVTADIISSLILGKSSGIGGPGNIQGRVFDRIPVEYAKFYMNSDAALMQYIYSMTKKIEARRFFGKVPENISKIKQRLTAAQTSLLNLNQQEALLSSESSLTEEQQNLLDSYQEQKATLQDNITDYNAQLERYKLQRDYTENIGALINDLMIQGRLNKNDEQSLKEMLNARFNERGTTGIVHNYKNLSYIDIMGNPFSAITQIGDLAWAAYVGKAWTPKGFADTTKHLVQAIFNKSNITKEDLGIERMAQEFADSDSFSNAVSKVFKIVGLEKMDSIGKEVLINNAFSMYKRQVQTEQGRRELLNQIRPTFGSQSNNVINDLLADNPSENVKMLLYSRLLDFQPVSLSEMPEYYLNGGNWRILYMLKTYTIKQLDVFRNEVYRKFKDGDAPQKLEAMKNLVQLLALLTLANAGADELKDLIMGKELKFSDRVIENLLTIGGANRYVRMQANREGIGSAIGQMILPPFKFINSLFKDITKGEMFDLEESRALESVPFVGKLAYWHVGRGQDNRPSIIEQDFSEAGKKFNKFKKKMDEATDKRLFLQANIEDFRQVKIYESFTSSTREITALINKLKKLEQTTNVRKRIGQLEMRKEQIMKRYFEVVNKND